VEELFSLVTLHTYPCNNDSSLETGKRYFTETTLEADSDEAGSLDSDTDTDTGRGHDEDSAVTSESQVHI
jgi:hypothetical protein